MKKRTRAAIARAILKCRRTGQYWNVVRVGKRLLVIERGQCSIGQFSYVVRRMGGAVIWQPTLIAR